MRQTNLKQPTEVIVVDTNSPEERLLNALKKSDLNDETLERVETTEEDAGDPNKTAQVPKTINVFQHPTSHPVVLDLLLIKKYELEWFKWEQETLRVRIPHDFPTAGVSDLNWGKIQAVKAIHMNETYWHRWEVFNWITQPFNNLFMDPDMLQVPSTAQMMVSIETAKRIRNESTWADDVIAFITQACKFDGVFFPPEPLDFIDVPVDHGMVSKEDIAKLWPSVRRSGVAPTEETIIAEQLRRNLAAYNFLNENRKRLESQMIWLLHV